jgi:Dolichyl-phosphate-mannose-protein mannosyltransferase
MKRERAILLALFAASVLCLYSTHDERGPTARITADAWYYHVYTVSLVNDRDLDFTDEYKTTGNWYRFGPTAIGRPGNPFGVGAPLMTVPLYLVGTLAAWIGGGDTGGFGTAQIRLIVLASPLFSVGAVVFAWRLCRRRLGARAAALAGPIALFLAGPVLYYAVRQPGYAHPQATFFAAWLVDAWDASFDGPIDAPRRLGTWLLLGALAGATTLARPQLAPWTFLLGVAAVDDVRRGGVSGRLAARWLVAALVGLVVFAPQLLAWKAVYGSWLVVPQGPGFMVWGAPAWSEVLFSARNGLFAWAPLYAVAGVGLAVAVGRTRRLAICLIVGVILQVWTNGAVWDWWGGGAYGGRRFDSCYVAFAYGLGVLLAGPRVLRYATAALTVVCVVAGVTLAFVSNVFTLEGHEGEPPAAYLTRRLPPPIGAAAGGLSWLVTAPARLAFAWAHGSPMSSYDRVSGVHLLTEFYPGLLGKPAVNKQTVVLKGNEPTLIGFEATPQGARMREGRGRILISLNRRHGPITVRISLAAAPAEVLLSWDGKKLTTTAASDGVIVSALEPIERGVHDLEVTAAAGTIVKSVELEVPAGTPP